ncbi:MAG: response regulator [Halolamina sp.]
MPGRPTRILHVDDDPDFSDLVQAFLEREDESFEVVTETSASAGIDRLQGNGIDCVVSDYEMPESDGLAFLERVQETHPELPFILFTGKDSEEIASRAISPRRHRLPAEGRRRRTVRGAGEPDPQQRRPQPHRTRTPPEPGVFHAGAESEPGGDRRT